MLKNGSVHLKCSKCFGVPIMLEKVLALFTPTSWSQRMSRESSEKCSVFLTVTPYDPDRRLGLSSLCRLEAATGMEVMTPIVERLGQFNTDFHFRLEAAGMRLMTRAGDELMDLVGGTPPVGLTADKVKKMFLGTMEPKTWRTLYSILNVLDMEGVVEEIEFYLSSKYQWEWVFL